MGDDPDPITWGEPAPQRGDPDRFRTVHGPAGGFTTEVPGPEQKVDPHVPAVIADRYDRREPIGRGGMGVVWRYWDRRLRRPVALKCIGVSRITPESLARFEEEAHISAQLQHPGIIPIHDLGRLDDDRLWFTMKEVKGRTLEDLLVDAHAAWRLGRNDSQGLSFRRLVEAFLRVCETVAYAHANGVIHRDLKPSNVMVGNYGEVLVLDWGLAKVIGTSEALGIDAPRSGAHTTQLGMISGTPAYMAPEQARGQSATAGPPADVHALGATLYDLLTERPPRIARSVAALVALVAQASPVRPPSEVAEGGAAIDEDLDRICLKALAADPADRYPDAGEMAAELASWLDGARRRDRAMTLIEEADDRMGAARIADAEAEALAAQAKANLQALPPYVAAASKELAWAIEDDAESRFTQAHGDRTRAVQLLRSSLSHAPDLTDAHDRLSDYFVERHSTLEAAAERLRAQAALADLVEHDRTRRHAAYVSGTGALSLVTDPPGATVRLHRYVQQGRRLVATFERELGTTPLRAVPVGMGSYLCTLHKGGHPDVRYPVWIRRSEHWDPPEPVRLPRDGELGPDDIYVPGGWFWAGDDDFEATLPLERHWMGPRVMRRFVVTTGEYVGFLNHLLDAGKEDEALEMQPTISDASGPWFERDAARRWVGVRTDHDAPVARLLQGNPRIPVVFVNLHQAQAFAKWTGPDWRIPTVLEWQRAARGADQRTYPWGDHFEPSWTRSRFTEPKIHIVGVDAYPVDVSPFGVRGMAGNVIEWATATDGQSIVAGGACASGPLSCSVAHTAVQRPEIRLPQIGMRLLREFV